MGPRRLAVSVVLPGPDGLGDVVYLPGEEVPAPLAATVSNDEVWADDAAGREASPLPAGGRRPRRGAQAQADLEVGEEA